MSSPNRGVLCLTATHSGCEKWRVAWPVAALQAQGYPAAWQYRDTPPPADLAQRYAAVSLTRLSWPPEHYATAVRWIDDLHAQGLAVLYELDDDILSDAFEAQAQVMQPARTLAELRAERLARRKALALCDGVTVPTPALAQLVEQYTRKPVAVVPSAIPWAAWRAECRKGLRYGDGVTIGWAGGKRTDGDFVEMAEAWGRIAARYPAVRFVTVGYCSPLIRAAVPATQLIAVPWQPVDIYQRAHRGIDIMCCPLADTPFNRCKSPIKAFEAAAAGAVVVASPTVYGQVMRNSIDGLFATTAADWTKALAVLLDQPGSRGYLKQVWAERVRTRHNLDVDASAWPRAWQRLIGVVRVPAGVG
jgi:glycosyltransferase involved in cell wall biosynthesis